jgi:hypothetical protein
MKKNNPERVSLGASKQAWDYSAFAVHALDVLAVLREARVEADRHKRTPEPKRKAR